MDVRETVDAVKDKSRQLFQSSEWFLPLELEQYLKTI